MNWRLLTARIVLALATLAMAVLTGCASRTIIGLALLLTTASVAEHVHAEGARNTFRAALAAAWLLSGCVVYTLSRGNEKVFGLYLAFTAWLVSAVLSPFSTASFRAAPVGRRLLAITWLCFGTGVALTLGYTYDATEFMVGLAGLFVTILVLLWWFKMPGFCRQALITLLLVIAGLPIVSHFLRPMAVVQEPVTDFEKYYSYEAAKKDPDAYRAWQYYAMTKWMAYEKVAMDRKHVGDLPWHLRPNTRAKLYDGEIPINSLGFAGRSFRLTRQIRIESSLSGNQRLLGSH